MALIAATNLRHAFGNRVILDGMSLSVEPGARIGIVGRNGTGKTTLLKMLAGATKADEGEVNASRGIRVGYLSQDPVLDPEETLRGAAEGAFDELHRLHKELDRVFHDMASAGGEALDKLMRRQERLQADIEAAGGYAVDHKIDATLHGLGFTDAQFSIAVRGLSGGQKGRLALARLLLEEPDILLLDEPTNHLDLDGRLWLEEFLKNQYTGAVVMISHDRYLLDNVVSRIIETEAGRLYDYPGNYAAFREIRILRRTTQMRAYEKQQDRFRQEEAFIRRYGAGQRARQAQGRLSKLERAKEQDSLDRPMEMAELNFTLPKADRSGDIVASARGLSKAYTADDGTQKVLFHNLDLTIARGERWGIIGPNGAGKTTLVRALLGEITPDSGTVRLGSNLKIGYYRQSHDHVPQGVTVYRYLQGVILKESPDKPMSEQQARNLAGAFLFSGPEQEADMSRLSGGERSRAVLAGLLASAKNVLVLDEPTNHLDIPSAERLEEFLALTIPATSESDAIPGGDFDGTLILISHDRAFIDATCDHLLILDGKGNAEAFTGNYTQWHEREAERKTAAGREQAELKAQRDQEEKKRRAAEDAAKRTPALKPAGTNNPLAKLKSEQLEKKIEETESRIRAIDAQMGDAEVWKNTGKMQRLGDEREKLVRELEPLEFEWMRRAGE